MVEPYKEGGKNDICYSPGPYKEGGNIVQQNKTTKWTKTTNDTKPVHNPVDYKSIHNRAMSGTTESLEPWSQPSKLLRSWIELSMARDVMRFGCWGSSKWRALIDLPTRWGSQENLELEGALKPDACRTFTAVEDLVAYWKRQIVPTKEGKSVGVSSHPRAPASPTHTRPNQRKKKWNRKNEMRGVVEAARGRQI